jgi:hypothetical protein
VQRDGRLLDVTVSCPEQPQQLDDPADHALHTGGRAAAV